MSNNSITIDRTDMSNEKVMSSVLKKVFEGKLHPLRDIEEVDKSSWGDPNSWYTSGKFKHTYALVSVEKLLQLHDSVGHVRSAAYQETVDSVSESIQAGKEQEIPTVPLVLEPDKYGENPMVYKLVKEGRSRTVGAKEAGKETIPVIVSVRRPTR